MANADSTIHDNQYHLLEAVEKLDKAVALTEFVQSISLNGRPEASLVLQPAQLTGFYYVMQNAIDLIKEAGALIETTRHPPEVLPG